MSDTADMQRVIEEHTQVGPPWLCPELKLRLVTPACGLWRAGEQELAALGIPEPYWGFCWPGGQALARYVLDNTDRVAGRTVVDFGAGSGVCAIAAAAAGASRVLAADIDPWAGEAVQLNAHLNHVDIETTVEDLVGRELVGWDVLLAGDMCYEGAAAQRHLRWLGRAARSATVLVADPGRGWLRETASLRLVGTFMAPADVDTGGRHLVETQIYEVGAVAC